MIEDYYNEREVRELMMHNDHRTNNDLRSIMLENNNASRLIEEIIIHSNSIARELGVRI